MPKPLFQSDFKPKRNEDIARLINRKVPLTSKAFDVLTLEQRARAFRIAGVNKAALIQQAQNEISKAIRDRTSFRDLRIRMLRLFEDAGIDAPNLNHLRTVIRTNMNHVQSMARDRMLARPAVRARFPYMQYVTVGDADVRATHAALDGKIFRADDPFWTTYNPPWEWGCRCDKIPVNARQLKRLGIEVETLADIDKGEIPPARDFATPKAQQTAIDKEVLRAFKGDLKTFVAQRFKELDADEARAIAGTN